MRPGQKTDVEKTLRQREAAKVARAIWNSAEPAKSTHAYLRKRKLKPHGLKEHKGSLIVPVTDRGMIISLQYIHTSGTKRFMPNGRTRGGYYCIGIEKQAETICVAESFAAAASIKQSTGHAVAVAFHVDNIKHVSMTLKELYPFRKLVVCRDADCWAWPKERLKRI